METSSLLSSLHDECRLDSYLEPHYKEWYRIAIDALIEGGLEAYQEFLAKERCSEFLADDEIKHILNTVQKIPQNTVYAPDNAADDASSSGTYWPMESDVEAPNLDLGWPYVMPGISGGTNIELLFHPPRVQPYTIKETIRKMIKEARKVIAIVMDIFTDVDIFKEIVEASTRGISVYLLLDESNFDHFLKMTEKQNCQVQRLRNMRVRTVKGQDYFSKSGAKFHGKMEQKFLLVDCKKVMYGTYSFMWSFEKANLSMVQIITGQLVESFDEEFRTLYARSSVPSSFAPELVRVNSRQALWENSTYQHSHASLASISSQRNPFGRQVTIPNLDPNFLKSRGRYGINDNDTFGARNQLFNKAPFAPGFHMQNRIQQYQPNEINEHWKRHSYAGEKPERTPYLMLNRAMNRANNPPNIWKVPSDSLSIVSSLHGSYTNHNVPQQSLADRLPQPKLNIADRNSVVRRSFNGTDNHIRFLQQRMPTLERTTKSFLRNWRIESYLNDQSDFPPDSNGSGVGDRCEGFETPENIKAHAFYAHSRLRSSFAFKPTLPEQKEVNSCASSSNSTIMGSEGSETPKGTPNHVPKPENATDNTAAELIAPIPLEPDIVKSHNLQISEDTKPSITPTVTREQPPHLYSTLSTSRPVEFLKNHQNESILKRRSFPMFDNSKSTLNYGENNEASNYGYSTLNRNIFRRPTVVSPPAEDSLTNSKSFHNVANHLVYEDKSLTVEPKLSPTAKSISVAALVESIEESGKDVVPKKENKNSPSFLKKGSQKLRSLLNLTPEKKENLSKNKAPVFYRMCSSSDTLVSEGEELQKPKMSEIKIDCSPIKKRFSSSNSQGSIHKSKEDVTVCPSKSPKSPKPPKSPKSPKSLKPPSDENLKRGPPAKPMENMLLQLPGDASAPRFNTEQIQYQDIRDVRTNAGRERIPAHAPVSPHRAKAVTTRPTNTKTNEELLRPHLSERRIYSRFEPFCKMESSVQPMGTPPVHPKSSGQVAETNSKTTRNNYTRGNHQMVNYNPVVYHPLHPNENKFRGFMQKFGNFIYKNK